MRRTTSADLGIDTDRFQADLEDLARCNAIDGWSAAAWPHFAPLVGLEDLVRDVNAALDAPGWAVIHFPWLVDAPDEFQASVVTAFGALLARPLRVFGGPRPLWRHLGVDVARPPDRSEGVGLIPLHIDFVNAEFPPDYIYLYCRRPDRLGRGLSLLARHVGIGGDLTPADVDVLSSAIFRDGKVIDLEGVGRDVNPFPVLGAPGLDFRYTEKLLRSASSREAYEALGHLKAVLAKRTVSAELERGDLLIINQHRTLHGREPLGVGQKLLSDSQRRLMMQGYGRLSAPEEDIGIASD